MIMTTSFIFSVQASARQYIKDVMLIGGSKGAPASQLDSLKQQLTTDGWTFIDYDLNKGGYGCYIFMLYKDEENTDSINRNYITDFYLTDQDGTVPDFLTHNGRTYRLVPYDGKWDFTTKQGNLNAGTGDVGANIHLYYTKDTFPDNHAISTIYFTEWKDEPVVHLNGGSALGDFNLGCTGYKDIFMHYTTGTTIPNRPTVSALETCSLEMCKLSVSGWAYDIDEPGQSVDIKVSIYREDGTTLYRQDTITANQPRADVNTVQNVKGNHGFSYSTIITDPGTYVVKVYVCDYNVNHWEQINDGWTFTNRIVQLTAHTGDVTLNDGDILSGTGGADTHVIIADGATVALADVNITDITNDDNHKWAGITCQGDATVILVEGTTNNLKGGHRHYPCIQVGPSGKTLTIRGDGTLNADNNKLGAGIGGNYNWQVIGNIVIEGGIINATGGDCAAAIGGANYSHCGNITICGGTVTARGGSGCGGIGAGIAADCGNITITDGVTSVTVTTNDGIYSIGKSRFSKNCGTITIGGMVTDQISQRTVVYNPASYTFNFVYFDSNWRDTGALQYEKLYYYRPQRLTHSITRPGYSLTGWNTAADGSGTAYTDGQIVINMGDTKLYAQWKAVDYNITYNLEGGTNNSNNLVTYTCESNTITLSEPSWIGHTFEGWTWEGQNTPTKSVTITKGSIGDRTFTANWSLLTTAVINTETGYYELQDGQILTGKGGPDTHITIADGATVTLSKVTINGISNDEEHKWAGITCLGDAVIILADNDHNNLKGGYKTYPGIYIPQGKMLTIRGAKGYLETECNDYSAAIGGGNNLPCGNIRIESGTVRAKCQLVYDKYGHVVGAMGAAAIGGGQNVSCGDITITGGSVSAFGGSGAGIGCSLYGSCGDITITGGTIKATSESNAAGIGGAENGTCGNITITGGDITASTCSSYAPGIGSGYKGSCGNITITGGSFAQYTYEGKPTVGCEKGGSCGTISIAPDVIDLVEVRDYTQITTIRRPAAQDDVWYDMLGRRLFKKPTTPGLYIHNGKKVVQ